jgi:lipid II:glycine glycyltransferase (peptidoglycan interpeptide bridge formation enzyme)
MSIRFATTDEIASWDASVAKNPDGGNVFQATALAEVKRRHGWTPRYLWVDNLAITVLEKSVPFLGRYWYLPKGPGITTTDELLAILPDLRRFAARQRVFVMKIEPEIPETDAAKRTLVADGLVPTNAIQPNSSTVIIDLSPDLDTIMASLNQKGRHALHRAERDGVTVEAVALTADSMRQMYNLLRETAAGRFETSIRDFDYYCEFWQRYAKNGRGSLFFAHYEGKLVAAAYCMYLGHKGLYKDGASIREKTAYGASHLLQWEVIEWMKAHGVTSYDLCGSTHSTKVHDTSDHFYGIGRFKTQFNKHITDYVGCYDVVIRPRAYHLWQSFVQPLAISLSYRLKRQQWF